jgi:dienelactone hydrolase
VKNIAIAVALVLLTAVICCAQQESWDQLLKHWDYDRSAPLIVKESGVQARGGITVHDISYVALAGDRAASIGPNGSTVTAFLVVPSGKGPFPAVVYGHWCMPGSAQLNRTEFLEEALAMARSGVISLLPDHVIARPDFVQDKTELNTPQIDVLVQQIVNTRRGIDLLASRKDVDPKRLAYVGHSCDGEVAGFLSGIEKKRLKAVVVMAGPLSDEVNIKSKAYQDYRQKMGPEKFDAFVAKDAWTDPGKYVSHSDGMPKLLQFATDEPMLNPEQARQYLPYVAEPKELKIYEARHALNAQATSDRVAFLSQQLGVRPPDAKAIAEIPGLVQPPWPK